VLCLRSHPFAFPCSVETLLSGVAHVASLRLSKALIIFTTSFISQSRLGCRPPWRGSSLAFGGCGRSCNRRRKCRAILSANVEHGDPLVTASATQPMTANESFAAILGGLGAYRCVSLADRAQTVACIIVFLRYGRCRRCNNVKPALPTVFDLSGNVDGVGLRHGTLPGLKAGAQNRWLGGAVMLGRGTTPTTYLPRAVLILTR
jgi:hypothetical protein